jgi:3-hydroxyacyl-[acyl-carrier-protein] dehydratase
MSTTDDAGPGTGAMDNREILAILPHRHPMLLVDRVVALVPGERVVAIKCVTANEPFFPGHFPGNPVFPGVLLVEVMAQTAGLLAARTESLQASERSVALLGIDGARFRRPVVPGDRLEVTVEVVQRRGSVWKVAGTIRVEGAKAAEAVLLVGLVSLGGQP